MNRPDEERELAPEWIRAGKKLEANWLRDSDTLQITEEAS